MLVLTICFSMEAHLSFPRIILLCNTCRETPGSGFGRNLNITPPEPLHFTYLTASLESRHRMLAIIRPAIAKDNPLGLTNDFG